MIKFSIVLPTYNVGQYIDRCLASCVNQTFTNLEIIVVDDCGQDDAIRKALLWQEKDSRIKIVHHDNNLGTYHARHSGVVVAKGEYVIFLDPDDTLTPNALEILNKLTPTKPDILLFGHREIPDKKIYQIPVTVPKVDGYLITHSDIKKILTHKGFQVGTSGKAYKRNIISEAFASLNVPKDIRLIYGEDVLVFTKAFALAQSIKSTQEKVYLYHQEETSISNQQNQETVLFKMKQLKYVIHMLNSVANSDSIKNLTYQTIIKRLTADLLVLENKTNITFINRIKNYYSLTLLTRNFRWTIKALLHILTFGFKTY